MLSTISLEMKGKTTTKYIAVVLGGMVYTLLVV